MPRKDSRKKIKRLERELLAKYPAYLALLQEQARREAAAHASLSRQVGETADAREELKGAIALAGRERLN